jgi:hypothetical protein
MEAERQRFAYRNRAVRGWPLSYGYLYLFTAARSRYRVQPPKAYDVHLLRAAIVNQLTTEARMGVAHLRRDPGVEGNPPISG